MSSPHSQPIKAPSTNIASAHVERFASGEATPADAVTLAQENLSPTTVTPRTTAAGITTPARYPPANTAQTRKAGERQEEAKDGHQQERGAGYRLPLSLEERPQVMAVQQASIHKCT